MKVTSETKLFIVEIERSVTDNGIFVFLPRSESLTILANDYNEASEKAIFHWESEHQNESIIDEDGSLKIPDKIKVRSIRLYTDNIIY